MTKTFVLATALVVALSGTAFAQGGGGGGGGGGNPACAADAQKLCADKKGADRGACMRANMDKLSDACKAAMAAGGGAKKD